MPCCLKLYQHHHQRHLFKGKCSLQWQPIALSASKTSAHLKMELTVKWEEMARVEDLSPLSYLNLSQTGAVRVTCHSHRLWRGWTEFRINYTKVWAHYFLAYSQTIGKKRREDQELRGALTSWTEVPKGRRCSETRWDNQEWTRLRWLQDTAARHHTDCSPRGQPEGSRCSQ